MPTRKEKIIKEEQKVAKLMEMAGLGKLKDATEKNVYAFSYLESQQRKIIRMEVLEAYLQMDVKIGILIQNFFFHHCREDSSQKVEEICSSEEFVVFTKNILDEMPFLRKISVLKTFIKIPKDIISIINKINDLRNAMSHSLLPEKLRGERVLYKGKNIFTLAGIKDFDKDYQKVMNFLQSKFVQAFKDNTARLEYLKSQGFE